MTEEQANYRAALIGAGRIGMGLEKDVMRLKPATHFGMWNSHPRVELVAVCDKEKMNLQEARTMSPNIEVFENAEEMLSQFRPEIVSIATWRDTHFDMMKLCAKYDVKAIVCEKPIAEDIQDAKEIVSELRAKDVYLFINHRRRYDELLYPFINELEQGLIGEIIQVNCFYVYGLLTTGTHLIDTLRMFFNGIAGEIQWVIGLDQEFRHFSPADDCCVDGWIGFQSGLKVAIQTLDMKSYDNFDVFIYGRTGKVLFTAIGRELEIYHVEDSREHKGFQELSTRPAEIRGGKPRNQFNFLANNVIECLSGRGQPLSTGEDSIVALEVLSALRESAQAGGKRVWL